jgi:hypothetical protein
VKKLLLLLLFIPLLSCNDNVIGDCYVSPEPDKVCTKEYQPVCACNGLVYGNACEAEKAGNLKWKSTTKDSGEECSY